MIQKVEILPFHHMGEIKKIQMGGKEDSLLPKESRVSEHQKQKWIRQLKAYGCAAETI